MTARDEEILAKLRRTYEAYARGDFDTAIEIAHPDIEFITADGISNLRGVEQLRAWMEPETMVITTAEVEEMVLSESKVLVHQHNQGRGVTSGIEVDMHFWAVWTVNEECQATRVELFLDGEEAKARKVAGLGQ